MKNNHGFTLIELMVVLIIVAIFMAIAIPSYQSYIERRDLAIAKQESLRIANELERFRAKNFSYKGFDPTFIYPDYDKTTGKLFLPKGATSMNAKYFLILVGLEGKPLTIARDVDGKETSDSQSVKGLGWVMAIERVKDSNGEPVQQRNYDLLLTSTGVKCMTKTKNIVSNYINCGSDGESW